MEHPGERQSIDPSIDDLILIASESEKDIYEQQQILAHQNQNVEMVTGLSTKNGGGPRPENLGGSSTENASGSSTEYASGSSTEYASGSSTEYASGSSTEYASGSSTEYASGSSTEYASGSSTEYASGSSTENASGSSTEDASDSSTEEGSGSSTENYLSPSPEIAGGPSYENTSGHSIENISSPSSENVSGFSMENTRSLSLNDITSPSSDNFGRSSLGSSRSSSSETSSSSSSSRSKNSSRPGFDNARGHIPEITSGPVTKNASGPITETTNDMTKNASGPGTENASGPVAENTSGPVTETSSGPITETYSGPVTENASGLASGPSMEMEGPISKKVDDSSAKTTGDQGAEVLVGQGPPPAKADASAQAAVQTPSENRPGRTAMSKSKSRPSQELENQFILRVPPEYASTIRDIARSRDVAAKNRLKIDLSSNLRRASVEVDKTTLTAKLVDLPCVVGSLKTFDKKNFYATADISQMLVCTAAADSQAQSSPEEPTTSANLNLTEESERRKKKTYTWKHGITPPLKNVRKKRFRKITKKTADLNQFEEISFTEYVDSPEVEKEVKRLLCSDAEAISARWEVISGSETKEIECQGSIPSFQMSLGTGGRKRDRDFSEYKLLPEMFDDSSTDTDTEEEEKEEEEEEITVLKVVDKKREEEEEKEEEVDDEDEELIEDEEEDNEYEEALERELQTKLLESDMYESKEIITSLVMTIQKQMSFLEKKLFGIQWKIQRQKRLLTKVESLPLKTHLNSVLEKLKVEEKLRNEQLISLKENLRYVLQK